MELFESVDQPGLRVALSLEVEEERRHLALEAGGVGGDDDGSVQPSCCAGVRQVQLGEGCLVLHCTCYMIKLCIKCAVGYQTPWVRRLADTVGYT